MNSVLVLNADFSTLNVTTLKRAISLVSKGKAEIVKSNEQALIRSEKLTIMTPIIIRLFNYVGSKLIKFRISRNRIYKRDAHACGYCGSKKNLTIDHILPKSRGGKNEWSNLVTCCYECNSKKADRTPEEANMKLRVKPKSPELISEHQSLKDAWLEFLNNFN